MMIDFLKKYSQCIITLVAIIIIFLVCILTCIISEVIDLHLYFGWQEVKLTNSLSIKVPGDWVKGEKNGLIYFTDSENRDHKGNGNIVFFQSKAEEMFSLGDSAVIDKEKTEENNVSDKFQSIVNLNSTVNSLGTVYGNVLISADDCTYNEKYIEFSSDYVFYSWGGEMDDATLEKIADSVELTD